MLEPVTCFATSIFHGGGATCNIDSIFASTAVGFCYSRRGFLLRPSMAELGHRDSGDGFLLQPSTVLATSIHGGAAIYDAATMICCERRLFCYDPQDFVLHSFTGELRPTTAASMICCNRVHFCYDRFSFATIHSWCDWWPSFTETHALTAMAAGGAPECCNHGVSTAGVATGRRRICDRNRRPRGGSSASIVAGDDMRPAVVSECAINNGYCSRDELRRRQHAPGAPH